MDPNACLAEIRRIVARHDQKQADVDRLVELVSALDEWLSRGGFPPKAWPQINPAVSR